MGVEAELVRLMWIFRCWGCGGQAGRCWISLDGMKDDDREARLEGTSRMEGGGMWCLS